MFEDFIILFHEVMEKWIGTDRLRMRRAMKYWCATGGCLTANASGNPPFAK